MVRSIYDAVVSHPFAKGESRDNSPSAMLRRIYDAIVQHSATPIVVVALVAILIW